MLDRYLWGRVTSISEAPVPVVKVENQTYRLGGAANVAASLAALGCRVRLLGTKGTDASGQLLSQLLAENKIEDHLLTLPQPHPTIAKTRVMAQRQQLLRLDEEETGQIDPADSKALLDLALQSHCGCEWNYSVGLWQGNHGEFSAPPSSGTLVKG